MANITPNNYIFASLFTGVFDVNRNELLKTNDFSVVEQWYNSVMKMKQKAIVFHNTFSEQIIKKYSNEHIRFVNVTYDGKLNPNIYRYFVYKQFLEQTKLRIDNLFITDISDVEVIQNPFDKQLFLDNNHVLFCGDEPEILDTIWMKNHCEHLRNSIADFSVFEEENKHKTLLNCGIVGGNITVMEELLNHIVQLHEAYSYNNTTAYTLDMGVFNYVARTKFRDKIMHGAPINTAFKKYDAQNTNCWFRHK